MKPVLTGSERQYPKNNARFVFNLSFWIKGSNDFMDGLSTD